MAQNEVPDTQPVKKTPKEQATAEDEANANAEEQKREQREGRVSRATADRPQPKASSGSKPNDKGQIKDSAGNISADKELLGQFLKASGYREADVVGSNQSRRSFVTSNGGKYVLLKSGKNVRVLSGPATPAMIEAVEEEDEDA